MMSHHTPAEIDRSRDSDCGGRGEREREREREREGGREGSDPTNLRGEWFIGVELFRVGDRSVVDLVHDVLQQGL